MDTKESPQIAINEEVKIPFPNEAISSRNEGGNYLNPIELEDENRVPTQKTRPSTGKLSRYPGQVQRKGVVLK